MNRFTTTLFVLTYFSASAQMPVGTDVWLLDMTYKNGTFKFTNPLNVTNRQGYDNQPAFAPDDSYILYSSIHEDKQADIYKYTIQSKNNDVLVKTPESEFSPTFMPGGKRISSVLIEKDSTQRLWSFSLDGSDVKLVMENIDSIGYHCWINSDSLLMFVLTQPFSLQAVNIKKQEPKMIAANIGRAIHKRNEQTLFTQEADSVKWICTVDSKGNVSKLVTCIKGSEDFALVNDHTLLMAQGTKLFKYEDNKDKKWIEVADLGAFGITKVTRLAVSHNLKYLAVVDNK